MTSADARVIINKGNTRVFAPRFQGAQEVRMKKLKYVLLFATTLLFLLTGAGFAKEEGQGQDRIINDYEELCEFARLVGEGNDFAGKRVFLAASVETENDFTIKGTFSGVFNALGNSVSVSGALFENLKDADIESLVVLGGALAENAQNTTVNSCVVSAAEKEAGAGEDNATLDEVSDGEAESTSSAGISGAFIGKAAQCAFYNCINDAFCFAGEASSCMFVNCLTKRADILVRDRSECVFSNVLSLVPLSDPVESAAVLQCGENLDETVALMNASRSDTVKEYVWSIDNGAIAVHTHKYEAHITQSTCVTFKKTEYICSCSDIALTVTDEAAGYADHVLGQEGKVIAPTCTEAGYTEYICTVCQNVLKKDETPALGHKEVTVGKTDATCVSPGYTGDKVCQRCQLLFSQGKITPATGVHKWKSSEVIKEPTGDENGEAIYYCANCDATRIQIIAALGHEIGRFTYYDDTHHSAKCSCGEIVKEEHDFVRVSVIKEPSADEEGEALYECSVCGAQKKMSLPATGHIVLTWIYLDELNHGGVCSCGEYETLPHEWDEGTLVSDGGSGEGNLKRTRFVCSVCKGEMIVEESADPVSQSPKQDDSVSNKKIFLAVFLLLLASAGAASCVYIKYFRYFKHFKRFSKKSHLTEDK